MAIPKRLSHIERMHRLYASEEGRVCRDCAALQSIENGVAKGVYTCAMAPSMPGQHRMVWNPDWPACGLFEPKEGK
jgi:hypothetical protein